MSRIGKLPISLPSGVEVKLQKRSLSVKGPRGTLTWDIHRRVEVRLEDKILTVTRDRNDKQSRALHGLTRALVNNMVTGVTEGFSRKLEIHGIGYSAKIQGDKLVMQVGYSHPVEVKIPEGLSVECPDATHMVVTGIDKQAVGQLAADIRSYRKPEPYKGKGIRYEGEVIRRKAGKAFVGGGA